MVPPRVVIVGGGFAGLHLARQLDRRLRRGEADVTLVDRNNYHLFTPLLYQVATGELPEHAVAYPLRQTLARSGFRFVNSEVEGVDLEAHAVRTADGALPYDVVVVVPGSVTNTFGISGVTEHAIGMKDLADGVAVRRRILSSFEEASIEANAEARRRLLTFVIVGAGPTGVELASSIRDLMDHSLRPNYPNLDLERDAAIVLIDGADRVIPTMDPRLGRLAASRLARQRVSVVLKTLVGEIGPGVVRSRDGREWRGNTIVWSGGVRASPLVAALPVPRSRDGRLVVDGSFRAGRDDVFCFGDAAWLEHDGAPLAQLAQVAVLEAPTVAENVVRTVRGEPLVAYRHRGKGELIALGRTAAGAQVGRFVFGGLPAWTVWRVNYLTQLLGVRNRASLLAEWILSYFFTRMVANTP